jgi:hypothetical protein
MSIGIYSPGKTEAVGEAKQSVKATRRDHRFFTSMSIFSLPGHSLD